LGGLDKVEEARLFHGSPFAKTISKDGFKLSRAKDGPFGKGKRMTI
jgi:hypothetical protein